VPGVSDAVWSEQNTTPGAIEAALRNMLKERHAESDCYVPARVLNLVCIVDKDWSGEIANRLRGVGRYHPSRTVVCAVEEGRTTIDAVASIAADAEPKPGSFTPTRETVIVTCGPSHLEHLETIVDPLVVTDLATVVWSPHGHAEAVDAILSLAQVVLHDTLDDPDLRSTLDRVYALAREAYVVDLAWLRSTPWRERIAAAFDPDEWRDELACITNVRIRQRPDSMVAGLLLFGWLATRLGWKPDGLMASNGGWHGTARGGREEVKLDLDADPELAVPGLAGITIETASGMSLSLDRGEGGLRARRVDRKGRESSWTIVGASRGEAGILGEGIRQALLRDKLYRPALDCAEAMVG
jgi:glucose-6-phosphate dehydrogenase assembly protein OpcA